MVFTVERSERSSLLLPCLIGGRLAQPKKANLRLQKCTCWPGFLCQVSTAHASDNHILAHVYAYAAWLLFVLPCLRRLLIVYACWQCLDGLCSNTDYSHLYVTLLSIDSCHLYVQVHQDEVLLRGLWVSVPPAVSPTFAAPPRQVGVHPHASFHTHHSPLCHKLARCAAVAACLTLELPQHLSHAVLVED